MRTGAAVLYGIGAGLVIAAWLASPELRVVRPHPPAPTAEEEAGPTSGGPGAAVEPAPAPRKPAATGPRAGADVKVSTPRAPDPVKQDAAHAVPSPGQLAAENRSTPRHREPPDGGSGAVEHGAAGEQATAPGGEARSDSDHTPVLAPPVLVSRGSSGYPSEGYRIVLDRNALTPRLRVEAAQGLVVLRVLVRRDGSVAQAEVMRSSGVPALDAAALRSAATWNFTPATRDGTPIEAWVLIPVRFVVP